MEELARPMKTMSPNSRGFTMVELLVTVAVIAILSSIAIPIVRGFPDAAKKDKLEQNVILVNNAIDTYLASGGKPTNLTSANVIDVLKSRIYAGTAAEMMGPQGPFLDLRIVTNSTDFGWSALFVADPQRPRFNVVQNTNGVVFDRGPASAVGGVAARPDAARPSWLWSYAQATPPPQIQGFTPVAVDTGFVSTNPPPPVRELGPPEVVPGSLTNQLWGYPLEVSMTNTNEPAGASRIYYKAGQGNYALYDDVPFRVGPGTELVAICVSLDPSRYRNSAPVTNFYGVTKMDLAVKITAPTTVSYAQAGGRIQGVDQMQPVVATITLEDTGNMFGDPPTADDLLTREVARPDDKFIPSEYLTDANFVIRYTTDGSNPIEGGTTGPSFNGFFTPVEVPLGLAAWGTNSSLVIRAVAVAAGNSILFNSSDTNAPGVTSSIAPMSLPLTVLPADPIGLPFQVQVNHGTNVPVGLRKFYTGTGVAPLSAESAGTVQPGAIPYSAPVPAASLPGGNYTFIAQATGPAGYEHWFASPLASRVYRAVTALDTNLVGANISGGDVNGSFRGSIFVSAPANLGIFNAGGTITRGNLYLPGLPEIEVTGQGNQGTTVVAQGAYYTGSPPVSRSVIAGKEFSATGQLADPQLDTRQIVDQAGSNTNVYTVKITTSTFIEGKIYRNVDLPTNTFTLPRLDVTNVVSGTFNGFPTNAAPLASGTYSNNISLNNDSAVLRLGSTNSGQVTQYVFSGGTWSKGRVEIVGPVQIFFTSGFINSGVVFGATNTVDLLSVYVTAANADVEFKSGGQFYGNLWVTNGTASNRNEVSVGNGSILTGSVTAEYLSIAPGGVVNVE